MVMKRRESAISDHNDEEQLVMVRACADLFKIAGAKNYYAKFYISDDLPLHTWISYVEFPDDYWEVCAAESLALSAVRLVESCFDGSICPLCGRQIYIESNWESPSMEQQNQNGLCVYMFDPSTKDFVRGCN